MLQRGVGAVESDWTDWRCMRRMKTAPGLVTVFLLIIEESNGVRRQSSAVVFPTAGNRADVLFIC